MLLEKREIKNNPNPHVANTQRYKTIVRKRKKVFKKIYIQK